MISNMKNLSTHNSWTVKRRLNEVIYSFVIGVPWLFKRLKKNLSTKKVIKIYVI